MEDVVPLALAAEEPAVEGPDPDVARGVAHGGARAAHVQPSAQHGQDWTPSRPASSGETPPAGQDDHDSMAIDAPVAPVVRRALSERLAQLETATVAYAQGHCSL